ncbi:helix-turn-helix transcriptional regulator [Streptomyces sp. JJ66]|uniref:helix-turn-helix domain-containing protein n=1 Tax=Streptomyces sp. JJ66 TaxID=2803843 RepID=UPI001C56B9D4|nr:helix-turn-helix transcriptional regulator [Streptomyces sp. JJ66]MBW1601161.1 helix-turn-helix transcriptional regulator [Streptomyces sp. JJ66]
MVTSTRTAPSHGPPELPPVHSFAEALRTAIRARGLSLDRLHARLAERGIQVSVASLSNWQRGRCRPERAHSLHAVRALEQILGLPRAYLVARLGPPRPRGRWVRHIPGALSYRDLCRVPGSVGRLLGQIEQTADGQLEWLGCHERFRAGPDREERSVHTRLVFRARADGVDRHVVLHHNERGQLPDLHHCAYCRMGRVRTDPATGVTAVELLFERPLQRGETYVIEYEFGYREVAPPANFYQRWFRFPAHTYLLQVEFDPAALPTRCYRAWQPNVSTPAKDLTELRLTSWHTVHLADTLIRPGVHGIRWEWD